MVYYVTFQPHLHPADDTRLYTFVNKYILSCIIHRAKIKSKYNLVQKSDHQIEYIESRCRSRTPVTLKKDPLGTFLNA